MPFSDWLLSWHMGVLLPLDRELHHLLPGSQAFPRRLNYGTGFAGSPAGRWQSVGLLSLRDHVSQFLRVNLPIGTMDIFPISYML